MKWRCPRCSFALFGRPFVIHREWRQCCRCGHVDTRETAA